MVRVFLPQNGIPYARRIWGSLWKRTHKKIYGSCWRLARSGEVVEHFVPTFNPLHTVRVDFVEKLRYSRALEVREYLRLCYIYFLFKYLRTKHSRSPVNVCDASEKTPLHLVVQNSDPATVRAIYLLLQFGADVNDVLKTVRNSRWDQLRCIKNTKLTLQGKCEWLNAVKAAVFQRLLRLALELQRIYERFLDFCKVCSIRRLLRLSAFTGRIYFDRL